MSIRLPGPFWFPPLPFLPCEDLLFYLLQSMVGTDCFESLPALPLISSRALRSERLFCGCPALHGECTSFQAPLGTLNVQGQGGEEHYLCGLQNNTFADLISCSYPNLTTHQSVDMSHVAFKISYDQYNAAKC